MTGQAHASGALGDLAKCYAHTATHVGPDSPRAGTVVALLRREVVQVVAEVLVKGGQVRCLQLPLLLIGQDLVLL